MILHQFYLNCLAHASYLIGDEQTQTAAVVDPQRDIDQYLAFADEHELRIAHVFLTHFHADFVAGHLELRDRTGATIYLGAAARRSTRSRRSHDGDSRRVRTRPADGARRRRATRPESISILVFDLDRSATEPHAVLTGDTLFVGDVGRPDLRVALGWSAADLGGLLLRFAAEPNCCRCRTAASSIRRTAPARSAARRSARKPCPTIGEQRRSNYALQPMTKAAFVELVTADQPDAPPHFTYDAVLNSQERPTLDESLARELQSDDARCRCSRCSDAGGQILDTRDPGDFAAAHLAGSINIGLGGQHATWAGTDPQPRQADRHHRRSRTRERVGDTALDASGSIASRDS